MSANESLRVALIGGEAAGAQTLKFLLSAEVDIPFVCTGAEESAIDTLAKKAGLKVLRPDAVKTGALTEATVEASVDVLLNVHSLSLLPGEVVNAPNIGSFNLHPGPLPAYGGLGAPSWAIYNGESRYAVTLHWMTAGLDDGDIVSESWFDLASDATGLKVSIQCVKQGLPLVEDLVDLARRDPAQIPRRPQPDVKGRLYRRSDIPGGGTINWADGAAQISRHCRAASYRPFASPWGEPETVLDGQTLQIVAASLADERVPEGRAVGSVVALLDGSLGVVTGNGILRVERVGYDGRSLGAAQLLRLGQVLGT